ncbi:glycosyltransferase family 10 domain-containing protein [Helicobacter sp. MIT 14-3879]|uniref:glycosyltransferase family 10 domain-containing protein n=1 Tax=Helicobacter sp. MIT 14-3879 TaxID=2040649 RepID=UPI000E1E7FA1|nr:glycosyltransferase family 10 [Helicobacter sp. MIT 14-3879]RDU65480.1 glycosyltransferase [Helicobacter sp. MIT 14-3879]
MKNIIKFKILDWWEEDTEENFYNNEIIKLLRKNLENKYDITYSNQPDFLLYSCFGDSHLDYPNSCVRIFYSGENIHTDWNIADYGIDFDLMDYGERHLCYPLFYFFKEDFLKALNKHLNINNDKRTRFCSFLVSNGQNADSIRDNIFDKICSYKKVDSGGSYKNNIGGPIPNRYGDFSTTKRMWMEHYKFNICFENSTNKGYVTEKIIQSFAAGCIPIYWGDYSITDESYAKYRMTFNPKAFINVHSFKDLEEVVEEVKKLIMTF